MTPVLKLIPWMRSLKDIVTTEIWTMKTMLKESMILHLVMMMTTTMNTKMLSLTTSTGSKHRRRTWPLTSKMRMAMTLRSICLMPRVGDQRRLTTTALITLMLERESITNKTTKMQMLKKQKPLPFKGGS